MSIYAKVASVVTVFIVATAGLAFWFSANIAGKSIQENLDLRTADAAKLLALSLNDVDIDENLELVEYLINGAYNLGSFSQVSLFDANEQVRVQRQEESAKKVDSKGMFHLVAKDTMAVITLNNAPSGKVVVRSSLEQAQALLNEKINALMKLFGIIAGVSVLLMLVILKLVIPKNA